MKTVKQELQLHSQCEELPLELLPEGAIEEYLTVRFAGGSLPTKLARMIHQRTEGNPLFMVNIVDELIARAVLVQWDGQWKLAREIEEGDVPASLRHFIEQQLERLSPEEQQVLEAGSAAGIEFSAAAVAAGLEEPVETVEKRCEGLVRREQFLRVRGVAEWPDGTVAARYDFLHALYQEVVYERMAAGQRIGLHQRIGEREEAAYGTRAGEIAAELAVHFEQGREYKRAVQYLQQAGENAIRLSAHQEAIHHLTKGLELLKTLPDTPRRTQQELILQIALGGPLIATKGFGSPQVGEVYTLALELCQQVGETPRLFRALRGLSSFYNGRGDPQTGRKIGEQMLRLAQKLQAPALLLCTHHALGATLLFLGDLTSAREHLEQGASLYDRQQPCSSVSLQEGANAVCCLAYLSSALCFLGYPDRALERSREALNLAQKLSHPFSQLVALNYATNLHHSRREAPAVQEWAEANIVLSRERGFPVYLAAGMVLHGWALVEQGQGEEGIAQMLQGLTAMRTTETEISRPFHLSLLAEAHEKMGQVEEGLAVVVEALAMVERTEIRYLEARLHRLKGTLTLQSKASQKQVEDKSKTSQKKSKVASIQHLTPGTQAEAEAEACFYKAIEIARKQQAKSLELRATVSLAQLWLQQGKKEKARKLLAEIYGWFTEGFDTKDLQEAKTLLEKLSS